MSSLRDKLVTAAVLILVTPLALTVALLALWFGVAWALGVKP